MRDHATEPSRASSAKADRNLREILRGGYCTRWHANADMAHIRETLSEHHARVAQIILALHPSPSAALLDAALHHDAGEPRVGDVPWPAKRDNPALAQAIDEVERAARERLGIHINLSTIDKAFLKLADRLAGYMHVQHTAPHLLAQRDWLEDRLAIELQAAQLGVALAVSRLIEGAS